MEIILSFLKLQEHDEESFNMLLVLLLFELFPHGVCVPRKAETKKVHLSVNARSQDATYLMNA